MTLSDCNAHQNVTRYGHQFFMDFPRHKHSGLKKPIVSNGAHFEIAGYLSKQKCSIMYNFIYDS